jgi:hypothetical protein
MNCLEEIDCLQSEIIDPITQERSVIHPNISLIF